MLASTTLLLAEGCGGTIELGDDLSSSDANQSSVVAEEPGWTLLDRYDIGGAFAARFNPIDKAIYYGGRSSVRAERGLWKIGEDGIPTSLGGGMQVGGVVVDPCSGDVFLADDFGGNIFRSTSDAPAPAVWATGFHRGDDDPVGMAIAPMDHASGVLAPGEIAVVDRGSNGPDEVWAYSSVTPEGERVLHQDNGTLVDPVDVAVTKSAVYIADQGTRQIYQLFPDGSLDPIEMPPMRPASLAVDPRTQNLLVVDIDSGSIVRLDPNTGDSSVMFTELAVNLVNWSGLDISPDGLRLIITERATPSGATISVFELTPNRPPVAVCEDTVIDLDGVSCTADADVAAGSYDPDGDPIDVQVSDPGPYLPGDTEVTVTVTDSEGQTASCTATVTVNQVATGWTAANAVTDPEVQVGNSDHGLVVAGFFGGGSAVFDIEDVVLEVADDDSYGRMTGTMRVRDDGRKGDRNGEIWTVDVWLDPAPATTEPKRELCDPDITQPPAVTDGWRFFGLAEGSRIERADGLAFADLHQRPADLRFGFQIGDTANGKNLNFGMSGWLFFDHTDADGTLRSGAGDFNVDLEPVCE